uniref:Uncharacterized protein n=1 Tax=Aegilops tauschii subsp. strangulata TaxID=200361 RepID=A0A453LEN4_AEGTS
MLRCRHGSKWWEMVIIVSPQRRQLPAAAPVQRLAAAGNVVLTVHGHGGVLAGGVRHRHDLPVPPLAAEPEHLDDLGHGRPALRAALRAQHGRLDHCPELHGVEPPGEPGVGEAVPLAALHERPRPLHDLALDAARQLLQRAARADELQQQHAEAVDVAALGDLPPHGVLRRQVPERALDPRGEVGDALRDELGEAEVGHLGHEVRVQEHVAGLDVAVDDVRAGLVVQVREALGGAERDGEAAWPVERRVLLGGRGAAVRVEVSEEAVVGHVVVDDEPLVAAGVEAAEAEQVLVPDTAQDLHLNGELHLRLGRHRLQPLHRNLNEPAMSIHETFLTARRSISGGRRR